MTLSDDDQFATFYAAKRGQLRRAIVAWTGDRHTADDVVQEVMLLVRHYWGRYDRPEVLMYRVAKQELARRRPNAEVRVDSLNQRWDQLTQIPAAPATAHVEGRLDLLRAMRQLPARQREVVVLTELCDLDQATAAEILGISVSALKTHKARGIRALHALLKDRLTAALDNHQKGGDGT